MFLKHPISILEWFLEDGDTEDWSNDYCFPFTAINYIFKYIKLEICYFKL